MLTRLGLITRAIGQYAFRKDDLVNVIPVLLLILLGPRRGALLFYFKPLRFGDGSSPSRLLCLTMAALLANVLITPLGDIERLPTIGTVIWQKMTILDMLPAEEVELVWGGFEPRQCATYLTTLMSLRMTVAHLRWRRSSRFPADERLIDLYWFKGQAHNRCSSVERSLASMHGFFLLPSCSSLFSSFSSLLCDRRFLFRGFPWPFAGG